MREKYHLSENLRLTKDLLPKFQLLVYEREKSRLPRFLYAHLFGGRLHASSGHCFFTFQRKGTEMMAGYMTTIRIYNDPNDKRTFVRQMVQDFQEYEDISDFKASLFELTKEYFSDENIFLQNVNIGFVGASNQKSFVNTSQQVYDAYNSRFLHKDNELVLFIERHKEKRQT